MTARKRTILNAGRRQGLTATRSGLAHIQRRVEWFVANWDSNTSADTWAKLHKQYPELFTAESGVMAETPPITYSLLDRVTSANLTLSLWGFPCISKDFAKIGNPPLRLRVPTAVDRFAYRHDPLLDETLGAGLRKMCSVDSRELRDAWLNATSPETAPTPPITSWFGDGDDWLLELLRDQRRSSMREDFFNVWTTGTKPLFTTDSLTQLDHDIPKQYKPPIALGKPPRLKAETASQAKLRRIKGAPLRGGSVADYRDMREAVERGINKARDLANGDEVDHYTLLSTILLEMFVQPE